MKINAAGASNYITGATRRNNIGDFYNTISGTAKGDELAVSSEALSFSKVFAAIKEGRPAHAATEPALLSGIASRVTDGSYSVDSETLVLSLLGDLYV